MSNRVPTILTLSALAIAVAAAAYCVSLRGDLAEAKARLFAAEREISTLRTDLVAASANAREALATAAVAEATIRDLSNGLVEFQRSVTSEVAAMTSTLKDQIHAFTEEMSGQMGDAKRSIEETGKSLRERKSSSR